MDFSYSRKTIVTPFIEKETREYISKGWGNASTEILIQRMFTNRQMPPEIGLIYVISDENNYFYVQLYDMIKPKFNLIVLSFFMIENEDTDVRYEKIRNIRIMHLSDNIPVEEISGTIEKMSSYLTNFKKIAVICPDKMKFVLMNKKLKMLFVTRAGEITPDCDFVIDTLIDENFDYITLQSAIGRTYSRSAILKEGTIYYRMISEKSFLLLPRKLKVSKFQLYLPILKFFPFNQNILKSLNSEVVRICNYFYQTLNEFQVDSKNLNTDLNLFPTILLEKKLSSQEVVKKIVSILIDQKGYITDFLDFGLTYEDNSYDFHKKRMITSYLYSKYGPSSSLLFYVNILLKIINIDMKSLDKFAEENFINKTTLLRIYLKFEQLFRRGETIDFSLNINEKNKDYIAIKTVIQKLYKNKLKRVRETEYIDEEGKIYSVSDSKVIYNWNRGLPKEITPLIIKNNYIYLWIE